MKLTVLVCLPTNAIENTSDNCSFQFNILMLNIYTAVLTGRVDESGSWNCFRMTVSVVRNLTESFRYAD